MRPIYRTYTAVTDADGISLDQAIAGGGAALTMTGALVVGGVATFTTPHQIQFTPGAGDDLTGINFTLTGTDLHGNVQSEVIAGPNAVVANSTKYYLTVTSITADVAGGAGETVSVGVNGVTQGEPIPLDQYVPNFNVMLAAILKSGAATFTAQYTFDDVFLKYAPANTNYPGQPAGDPSTITWWNDADITAAVASSKGSLVNPVKAVRLNTAAGSAGVVEFQVIQQGTQ
jgi:hypothetical protein